MMKGIAVQMSMRSSARKDGNVNFGTPPHVGGVGFYRMREHMNLKDYFTQHQGTGVLATSDTSGNVNTALYARPHVFDDLSVGFIMRNRLTRKNVLENGHASYLFREHEESSKGLRLRLCLLEELTDHELLSAPSRSSGYEKDKTENQERFLVKFAIEKCLVLIGGEEIDIQ